MSEEGQTSSFGLYIHNSIPEGFHVNPYQHEVKPCMQLQNSSFSFQDYKRNTERRDDEEEEDHQNEDGNDQIDQTELQNTVVEEQPTNLNEDIVEVDDNVEEEYLNPNTPVHNALNSFGSFIFDIYQSSAYYIPTNHSRIRTRFQYMNEYYRRMIQLIESSTKQEAASEETIQNLCVVCFAVCIVTRISSFLLIGVRSV